MSPTHTNCPASRSAIVDLYFLEHRAKLIDIAAFLDRLDRADDASSAEPDFRVEAFRQAIAVLSDKRSQRAKRILDLLSDHSTDPIPSAAGMKGAFGANPGSTAAIHESDT